MKISTMTPMSEPPRGAGAVAMLAIADGVEGESRPARRIIVAAPSGGVKVSSPTLRRINGEDTPDGE